MYKIPADLRAQWDEALHLLKCDPPNARGIETLLDLRKGRRLGLLQRTIVAALLGSCLPLDNPDKAPEYYLRDALKDIGVARMNYPGQHTKRLDLIEERVRSNLEALKQEKKEKKRLEKEGETEAPAADDASDGEKEEVWFEDHERPEHHKTLISMLNTRLREYNDWEAEKAWSDSREFRVPDHQQPVDRSFSNVRGDQ